MPELRGPVIMVKSTPSAPMVKWASERTSLLIVEAEGADIATLTPISAGTTLAARNLRVHAGNCIVKPHSGSPKRALNFSTGAPSTKISEQMLTIHQG